MAWRQPSNLREWLGILSRHKKKFFFTCMPLMIAAAIFSHWIPREYSAQAMFERINDAALEQMGSGTINRNLRPIRQGLKQDIRGRASIEQVIEDLQLLRDLPHAADGELTPQGLIAKYDLIGKLRGKIGISLRIKSSHLDQVVLTFTDTDRKLAPQIVNQLAENYIRNTRQQLDDMLLNAKSFFEREVDRYRARANELDSKKLRFELDNPGLLPNDPASVEVELAGLREQLSQTTLRMRLTKEERGKLEEWIASQPEFIEKSQTGQNPELASIQEKRMRLESELEQHLYAMGRTEEHPLVIRARSRLAELDQMAGTIDSEVVIGKELAPNTSRIAAERDIETLSGSLVALERQIEDLTQNIEQREVLKRNFFVVRSDYLQLQRELNEARQQLKFWEENLRGTITALTAEIGQRGVRMRFIERAPEIARPSKPTLSSILAVAAVLGVGGGGLMIILSELLNHSFRDVEQAVDELKLPVMGTVNEIVSPSELFKRKLLGWGLYPAVGAIMVVVLLSNIALVHMSLNKPHDYDRLITDPGGFINTKFFGES